MSKILKFIVNLFLIAAILVAAAILVPPVFGVKTTIVDTTSMDTNLSLGSVSYSTGVDVSELRAGDEILKETGTATYAYILTDCDAVTGSFKGVSAANPYGREEEIALRNIVPKVAVTMPYIGYVMIAMHSLEGIVIIALVVVLMIILFVLSELWKPSEEEEEEEELIEEGLDPEDGAGIDTDTIRATMEDNIAAVNRDEEEAQEEAPLTWAQKRAAKKARKLAEKEAKRAAKEEAAAEEETPGEAETGNEEPAAAQTADMQETPEPEKAEAPEVEENPLVQFDEIPQPAAFEDVQEPTDIVSAVEQVMAGILQDEQGTAAEVPALEEDVVPGQDIREQIISPDEVLGDGRFRRTRRPSLDEINDAARSAGDSPKIRRDDEAGVTIVDFSDSILK